MQSWFAESPLDKDLLCRYYIYSYGKYAKDFVKQPKGTADEE
jgi:hypothetical protein